MLSSKFHRFFLKNLNSNEVNTRILRISNVVQPGPSYSQALQYPTIPQYHQNTLNSFSFPSMSPPPSYPSTVSLFPTTAPPSYSSKPSSPSFSTLTPSYPTTAPSHPYQQMSYSTVPGGYSMVQTYPTPFDNNKQAAYSYYNTINYAQQNPSKPYYASSGTTFLNHQTSPTPFNNNNINPQRPFYNYKPQSPYTFQQFGMIDKNINNPFFKLNAGEQPNAPLQPASLQNYKLTGEFYRPSQFLVRSPSYNTTTVYH